MAPSAVTHQLEELSCCSENSIDPVLLSRLWEVPVCAQKRWGSEVHVRGDNNRVNFFWWERNSLKNVFINFNSSYEFRFFAPCQVPQTKSLPAHGIFEAEQNIQFSMKILPAENIKQKSPCGSSPLSRSHSLCSQLPKQPSNCCFPGSGWIHPDLFLVIRKKKLSFSGCKLGWVHFYNRKLESKPEEIQRRSQTAISLLPAVFPWGISHFKTWCLVPRNPWDLSPSIPTDTGAVTSLPFLHPHQLEPPIIPSSRLSAASKMPSLIQAQLSQRWVTHLLRVTQQVLFATEPKNLEGKSQEIQDILWLSSPKTALKDGKGGVHPSAGKLLDHQSKLSLF